MVLRGKPVGEQDVADQRGAFFVSRWDENRREAPRLNALGSFFIASICFIKDVES